MKFKVAILSSIVFLLMSQSVFAERVARPGSNSTQPSYGYTPPEIKVVKRMVITSFKQGQKVDRSVLGGDCLLLTSSDYTGLSFQQNGQVYTGVGFYPELVDVNTKLKEGFRNESRYAYVEIDVRHVAEYKRGVLNVESNIIQPNVPVYRNRLEIKTRGSVAEAEKISWSTWQGADEKEGWKMTCEEIPVG